MVERSNKKEVNEQTQASFEISRELWQRFQAKCVDQGSTTTQVLIQLIVKYLEETDTNRLRISSQSLSQIIDRLLTEKVREFVENYLAQNLESHVLNHLEHRLERLIQQTIEHRLKSSVNEAPDPSPIPEQPPPTSPQEKSAVTTLKTAKELGEILGVSAPYITTLNRIGELQQRGWEDSGQRRGKTILYKPID